jgi:uncharacterized protein (TIGR04562 family)
MSEPASSQQLLKKYDFRWEVLDILIGGMSIIDSNAGLTALRTDQPDGVDRFIKSYGYDLNNPIESAEAFGNFHEAIGFIRKYFLYPENPEGIRNEIPKKILEITDIKELFILARTHQDRHIKDWSCAILKVIHTICHLDKDARGPYFPDIQRQIFDRFYKVIHRDDAGNLYLGEKPEDPLRVNLVSVQSKPKKTRESTLVKLLHKPENVAEELFDVVGIRFVTKTKLDALRVVKYLKDLMIVMPANIKPSRSRNSLINLETLRPALEEMLSLVEKNQITEEAFLNNIESILSETHSTHEANNPHTNAEYRSIQFTGRQLIKLTNPLFENLKRLKQDSKKEAASLPDSVREQIEKLELNMLQKEVRFFYPYEVQITDEQSALENEKGASAHSEYKNAQLQTAMKRVLGRLYDLKANPQ